MSNLVWVVEDAVSVYALVKHMNDTFARRLTSNGVFSRDFVDNAEKQCWITF